MTKRFWKAIKDFIGKPIKEFNQDDDLIDLVVVSWFCVRKMNMTNRFIDEKLRFYAGKSYIYLNMYENPNHKYRVKFDDRSNQLIHFLKKRNVFTDE